jgi:hypothetical protein
MQKVWVCSIVGDDKLEGSVLVGEDGDVDDVRLAVKAHMSNTFRHYDAAHLEVFQKRDGTLEPVDIGERIPSNCRLNPLIIKVKKGAHKSQLGLRNVSLPCLFVK